MEEEWQEHMVKRHSFVVKNTPTFVPYEVKIQAKNHAGWAPEPETIVAYSGEDCKYMTLFFKFIYMGMNSNKLLTFLPVITFCVFYKKGKACERVCISISFLFVT